ncbi:hypothetical protein V1283_005498 [Bradyrhizobium sp. AZCC 2262]|uniref:hypothetical protein n=1 Tax=Bradyrhizobium sp. AZCC 2262 TaxID=3117022 RepID=UPI002FF42BD5
MRSLITTVALLALLDSLSAMAQTLGNARSSAGPTGPTISWSLKSDTRLIGGAPVGHRQPHVSDIPSEVRNDLGHINEEDATLDRKIIICRGC